jgi:hypothetical protein
MHTTVDTIIIARKALSVTGTVTVMVIVGAVACGVDVGWKPPKRIGSSVGTASAGGWVVCNTKQLLLVVWLVLVLLLFVLLSMHVIMIMTMLMLILLLMQMVLLLLLLLLLLAGVNPLRPVSTLHSKSCLKEGRHSAPETVLIL